MELDIVLVKGGLADMSLGMLCLAAAAADEAGLLSILWCFLKGISNSEMLNCFRFYLPKGLL
jgi:hypothetical protein